MARKLKKIKADDFALTADQICQVLVKQAKPVRIDLLIKILGQERSAKARILELLDELAGQNRIIRLPGGFWLPASNLKTVRGKFVANAEGGGKVVAGIGGKAPIEVRIRPSQSGGAWPDDTVQAVIFPGFEPAQGRVTAIIRRRKDEVLARVINRKSRTFVCSPVDRRMGMTFQVHMESDIAKKIKTGLLVSVRPQSRIAGDIWNADLVCFYEREDDIAVQESIVKSLHGVQTSFAEEASKQADILPSEPDAAEIALREDMRELPFVTIDGSDARDFDDAVYVEKKGDTWLLRVAIADVSYYVRMDKQPGCLDAEARKRGNSWYFPRSVEPMLPAAISNGLCSLKPQEDRLAILAEITFSAEGIPQKSRFAQIVMRSAARLEYEKTSKFLESGDPADLNLENSENGEKISAALQVAHELYLLLAENRRKRGSLDFSLPEPAYEFDEAGKPVKMGIAQSGVANHLIEEFMIAANEAVATFLAQTSIPFLYRVHPEPEATRLADLLIALSNIAPMVLDKDAEPDLLSSPAGMQAILDKARGSSQEYAVNRLCLRAMSQARYQVQNQGHFGLASTAYCHFTSPIRRYADLTVHRALKNALGIEIAYERNVDRLSEVAEELNRLEREEVECEREIAKRIACIVLKEHVGEEMRATISGIGEHCLFVELIDIPAEGLIPLQELGNEWFSSDPKKQELTGTKSGKIWRIGQALRVKILNVNLDSQTILLAPTGTDRRGKSGRGKKAAPGQKPGRSRAGDRSSKSRHHGKKKARRHS